MRYALSFVAGMVFMAMLGLRVSFIYSRGHFPATDPPKPTRPIANPDRQVKP